jgi:hypothetical protein
MIAYLSRSQAHTADLKRRVQAKDSNSCVSTSGKAQCKQINCLFRHPSSE